MSDKLVNFISKFVGYELVGVIGFIGAYLTPWDNLDWMLWGFVMLFGMCGTLCQTISPQIKIVFPNLTRIDGMEIKQKRRES